eukprot:ANDGO_06730.mRNA.1 Meiotically up-regulated gene 157 protein
MRSFYVLLLSFVMFWTHALCQRPPPEKRRFVSPAVDAAIADVSSRMKDRVLATMFEQCLPNTLDTTVEYNESTGRTFVITGDIPAMWLRDSANQVLPYLRFVHQDTRLQSMIKGVISEQVRYILMDAYANAFNKFPTGSPHDSDQTTKLDSHGQPINGMTPYIFERKFEIDSLAAFLRLSSEYFKATLDDSFLNSEWLEALERVLAVAHEQQAGTYEEDDFYPSAPPYTFARTTNEPTDSLVHSRGNPAKRCGLVKSGFRPSDDSCLFPFLVPANALFSVVLSNVSDMLDRAKLRQDLAGATRNLSQEIRDSIFKFGIAISNSGSCIFAYEIDGFGNVLKMDDANVPSLLSLPSFGFVSANHSLYITTRKFVLSSENPYFFKGKAGEGVGGPHVGDNYIWPMSLIMRALTSVSDDEILYCLDILKTTTAGTNFMHESFLKDNPEQFTRPWFAWANSLFGDLVLQLAEIKPHLLFA